MPGGTRRSSHGSADVAKQTIADFERGARRPYRNNLAAIERALETAGVRILEADEGGPGVRLAAPATHPTGSGAAAGPLERSLAVSPLPDHLNRIFDDHRIGEAARRDLLALLNSGSGSLRSGGSR